jgi:hypothetical protein
MSSLKLIRGWPSCRVLLLLALAASLPAFKLPAQTQCPEGPIVKFFAPPNVDNGWDVRDSASPIVLADDFLCNQPGYITDIHIWGSWLGDQVGTVTNFTLYIYNDVPASMNPLNGQVIPSHPGTNLLWSESFDTAQYISGFAGSGSEQFFDPPAFGFIGTDTQAYEYCFYPTNQFLQQGTAANPTNYWLALTVQLQGVSTLFGWKTSLSNYNDTAVWGSTLNNVPNGDWKTLTNSQLPTQPINLAFKLNTQTIPPTLCVETNALKYEQDPQVFGGYDVLNDISWVLADDFLCTNTGPITDIHLWGSFLSNAVTANLTFYLAIYDNIPVGPGNPNNFSMPGNLKWSEIFAPGQYNQSFYTNGQETFMEPRVPSNLGPDSQVWYFCFYPTNQFVQQGSATATNVYWLMVFAQPPAGAGPPPMYGWKTATEVRNDISVHAPWPGGFPAANPGWTPTADVTGLRHDLAFKIYTASTNPPPTGCVDTNGVKYVQNPNLQGGYDVWNEPYVLADDFICTNAGPVSGIHLWGSWMNDQPALGAITFWLGIYDDVPVDATNSFSHPGDLLWSQFFAPGQYSETPWASGSENFLDPGPPNIIGPESNVWYYCFFPTNPVIQTGSAASPNRYWLAAYAQLPSGTGKQFGWKSTTGIHQDISVHAPWAGVPPPVNPGWVPTFDVTGAPLDLAFVVSTPTNPCQFTLTSPFSSRKVECGTFIDFDNPQVAMDQCCPNGPWGTNFVEVLKASNSCLQIITGVWTVTNCAGATAYWAEVFKVEDTTPPMIMCPSNIVVSTCDSNISVAWTATAIDSCVGTNVTIVSTPSSPHFFPANSTNTVLVSATDTCMNTSHCSFTVAVTRAMVGTLNLSPVMTNSILSNYVVISWSAGILQSATNVVGPYNDVLGATSPYTNTPALPMKYFRLRCLNP